MASFNKMTIKDIDISNKRLLIRAEFNVHIENGVIFNPRKIEETIPTIKYALEHNAKSVVLMAHIGRPNGYLPELSLRPIQEYLEEKLGKEIIFISDCISDDAITLCQNPPSGTVFLLENLRFYLEETMREKLANNEAAERVKNFCHRLSQLGDIYVDDAFGSIHRNHSSLNGIELPVRVSGLLLSKELNIFSKALESSSKPLLGIIAGKKLTDNVQLIYALLDKVDDLIICGDMAYTFLKVQNGMKIGATKFDEQGAKLVNKIISKAELKGVHVHLPIDCVISEAPVGDFSKGDVITVENDVPNGYKICDIGPETIDLFSELIENAKSILLHGAPGHYKRQSFQKGSTEIMKAIEKQTKAGSITIGYGPDTENMINKISNVESLSLLSTGLNAVLHLLGGETLPALETLNDPPNLDTLLMMYMFF